MITPIVDYQKLIFNTSTNYMVPHVRDFPPPLSLIFFLPRPPPPIVAYLSRAGEAGSHAPTSGACQGAAWCLSEQQQAPQVSHARSTTGPPSGPSPPAPSTGATKTRVRRRSSPVRFLLPAPFSQRECGRRSLGPGWIGDAGCSRGARRCRRWAGVENSARPAEQWRRASGELCRAKPTVNWGSASTACFSPTFRGEEVMF